MSHTDTAVTRRTQLPRGSALKRLMTEAHKLLEDLLEIDIAKLGLSLGEADLLTVIELCEYAPVPGEIADWLSLTKAGATGRLNTLERRNLLERRPHPTDGRSVTLHLTPSGSELAEAVLEAKNATIMTTVVDRMGTETIDGLLDALDTLIDTARDVLDGEVAEA